MAMTWTAVTTTPPGTDQWNGVTMSADGKYLFANGVTPKYVRSLDFGATWSTLAALGSVYCCNASGSILYGAIYYTGLNYVLQKSLDYGTTWIAVCNLPGGTNSTGIRCSDDGTHIIENANFKVYYSANSGGSWTDAALPFDSNRYYAVAINGNGSVMMASNYGSIGGRIWLKIGAGVWNEVRPDGNRDGNWKSCCMDSTGTILVACEYNGRVWLSTDSGSTWNEIRPAGNAVFQWYLVRISKDGQVILALRGTDTPCISYDQGVTWQSGLIGTENALFAGELGQDETRGFIGGYGAEKHLWLGYGESFMPQISIM